MVEIDTKKRNGIGELSATDLITPRYSPNAYSLRPFLGAVFHKNILRTLDQIRYGDLILFPDPSNLCECTSLESRYVTLET